MKRKTKAILVLIAATLLSLEPYHAYGFLQNTAANSKPVEATVRVRALTPVIPGRDVILSLELLSSGTVNVVCFTLNFDPAVFTYRSSQLGADKTATANLAVNTEQTASGKFGLLVDSLGPFGKGTSQIATAVFAVAKDAKPGAYNFFFNETPTKLGVASTDGRMLNAEYETGVIRVSEKKGAVVGRVLDQELRGSRQASVVLKSENGAEKAYRTTSFGTFIFDDMPDGNYVIEIKSRNYSFAPINIKHKGVFTAVEFVEAT